jgi:radical SAM protein with 4Fe4S-binding SPASM domain
MNCFNGLSVINIELTNRCNKACWMCGRRKIEKDYPELAEQYSDIQFPLLKLIAQQVPDNIVIQFHNNGEPTLYPRLKEALDLFITNIKCFNTNGKLLVEKASDIIEHLDTLTISVIENDDTTDEQYEIVKKFLNIKKNRKPYIIYRLLGEVKDKERWYKLPGLVCTRILHSPLGSFEYKKKVTIPEVGICLDLLSHLSIDTKGDVYPCIRFNPNHYNKLGNLTEQRLIELWNSKKRQDMILHHKMGHRNKCELCDKCEFYGCPTGI